MNIFVLGTAVYSLMGERRFPNTYVIIAAAILLSAAATWFVPGAKAQTWQVFSALYNGFVKQAGIIVFILTVGGTFWILNETGAVSFGIRKFIKAVGKYDRLVLAGITVMFSLCGAVFGMSEETIPFVGIVVPLVISMGYDAIVGLLIVYVAAHLGFSSAFLNPFTVGIAQEMSGLQMFSGMGYRVFCWALLTVLLVVFVLFYAEKVRKEPQERIDMADMPAEEGTGAKKWILALLLLTIAALIVGVTCFNWYMPEIAALFLALGVLSGVISGFGANRIADSFVAGAKDILGAAMVVGFASGIIVILQDGGVIEPMLKGMAKGLEGAGQVTALAMMYGIETVINIFIPSATAKAAITIPVLAPFSDMIGVSRQAMVLAFQFGDGFTNMLTPTSGVLIAALGMAKIQYTDWLKRAWKWIAALILAGFVLLLPTVLLPLAGF